MSNELRHEVTMVVNGESRKVMVDSDPQPEAAQPASATAPVAANPKPAAKKAALQKPSLLERAKSAVTGKGKKA
jgi:hypothetical protein